MNAFYDPNFISAGQSAATTVATTVVTPVVNTVAANTGATFFGRFIIMLRSNVFVFCKWFFGASISTALGFSFAHLLELWQRKTVEYFLLELNSASITVILSILTLAALFATANQEKVYSKVKKLSLPLAFAMLIKATSFCAKWNTYIFTEFRKFLTSFRAMNDDIYLLFYSPCSV